MNNKIPCEMIRDLLPLYADGLTGDVTNEAVREHLAECPDCAAILARMQTPVPETRPAVAREIDYLKKNRKRNRRIQAGSLLAALLVAVLVLGIRTFVTGTELYGPTVASEVKVDGNHLTVNGTVVDSIHCISKVSFREEGGTVNIRTKAVLPGIYHSGSFKAEYDAAQPVQRIYLDGRLIWAGGTSIRPFAAELFASQHPYIGSMPDNRTTANALTLPMILGETENELETADEPYLWRITVKRDLPDAYREQIETDLRSCGAAMIGCIGNLSEVEFIYTLDGQTQTLKITEQDASALLGSDIKACYGDPAATQDMVLRLGLERFGYSWNAEP